MPAYCVGTEDFVKRKEVELGDESDDSESIDSDAEIEVHTTCSIIYSTVQLSCVYTRKELLGFTLVLSTAVCICYVVIF